MRRHALVALGFGMGVGAMLPLPSNADPITADAVRALLIERRAENTKRLPLISGRLAAREESIRMVQVNGMLQSKNGILLYDTLGLLGAAERLFAAYFVAVHSEKPVLFMDRGRVKGIVPTNPLHEVSVQPRPMAQG